MLRNRPAICWAKSYTRMQSQCCIHPRSFFIFFLVCWSYSSQTMNHFSTSFHQEEPGGCDMTSAAIIAMIASSTRVPMNSSRYCGDETCSGVCMYAHMCNIYIYMYTRICGEESPSTIDHLSSSFTANKSLLTRHFVGDNANIVWRLPLPLAIDLGRTTDLTLVGVESRAFP